MPLIDVILHKKLQWHKTERWSESSSSFWINNSVNKFIVLLLLVYEITWSCIWIYVICIYYTVIYITEKYPYTLLTEKKSLESGGEKNWVEINCVQIVCIHM